MERYGIPTAAVGISPTFAVFITASLLLAITPGPGVLYLVTRTLGEGRTAGLRSIGGLALGNLANAALASLGVAAVLAASARAITVVKLAGAAYLVFLGLCALRRHEDPALSAAPAAMPTAAFRDGFLVALFNPKTALFFAAFLPQFVDAGRSSLAQSLFLSGIFVSIAACTDTLYVFAADALGPKIARDGGALRSLGRHLTAIVFVTLGIFLALSDSRSAR